MRLVFDRGTSSEGILGTSDVRSPGCQMRVRIAWVILTCCSGGPLACGGGSGSSGSSGLTSSPAVQECGLPVDAFLAEWRSGAQGGASPQLTLDTVSRPLFLLLDQLDNGSVPAAFPSLKPLSPLGRRATIAAAAIRSTRMKSADGDDEDSDGKGSASSTTFKVSCADVRQIALGGPRTIAAVARAVNLAAGNPVSSQRLDAEPFKKHSFIWQIARANDEGEGLVPPKNSQLVSESGTAVVNPIKQLFEAFSASWSARLVGPGDLQNKKPWRILWREQKVLDALCSELGSHQVGAEFRPGPSDQTMTLALGSCPPSAPLPTVQWLGETAQHVTKTIPVQRDASGRCSAALTEVPLLGSGQLLIDMTMPGDKRSRLHDVDFAIRDHGPIPMMRPSRNGSFLLFTLPNSSPSNVRILIGGSGLPVVDLPPNVASSQVLSSHTVDFLTASLSFVDWHINVEVPTGETEPRLFHLPRGSGVWQQLAVGALEQHPFVRASFVGPGTYLLVRRAKP